jgi:hypothetical protein
MTRDGTIVKATELVTRKGFARVFWRTLAAWRRDDQSVSRREVFDFLNGVYFAEFGEDRYPSWNAFRHSKEYRSKD